MQRSLLALSSSMLLCGAHASAAPTKITLLADVVELASHGEHTCVRRKGGSVWCWGARAGAVTAGSPLLVEDATSAVRVAALPLTKSIAVGTAHVCALVVDGTIRCWGENRFGALGYGPTVASASPVTVFGLDEKNAIDTLVARDHTCALSSTKGAWCWGGNQSALLTNGGGSGYPLVADALRDTDDVALGESHACKLRKGIARCFGEGFSGPKGNAKWAGSIGSFTKVTAIATSRFFACVVQDGDAYCFGQNALGQLGDGTTLPRAHPVLAAKGVKAIATGDRHACAIADGGAVRCWGSNDRGQLGNGTTTSSSVAVVVKGLTNARAIVAGASHTCALLDDATVRCWGRNDRGQLGDGDTIDASTPRAVRID